MRKGSALRYFFSGGTTVNVKMVILIFKERLESTSWIDPSRFAFERMRRKRKQISISYSKGYIVIDF